MATVTGTRATAGARAVVIAVLASVVGVLTATSIVDGFTPVAAPSVDSVELPDAPDRIEPAPRPGELTAVRVPARRQASPPVERIVSRPAPVVAPTPAAPPVVAGPVLALPRVDLAATVAPIVPVAAVATPLAAVVDEAVRTLTSADADDTAKKAKSPKGPKAAKSVAAGKGGKGAGKPGHPGHGGRGPAR